MKQNKREDLRDAPRVASVPRSRKARRHDDDAPPRARTTPPYFFTVSSRSFDPAQLRGSLGEMFLDATTKRNANAFALTPFPPAFSLQPRPFHLRPCLFDSNRIPAAQQIITGEHC